MARRKAVYQLLVLSILAVAACDTSKDTTGPARSPDEPALARVAQDPTPTLGTLADVIPSFGGLYINAAGQPTVLLTDGGDGVVARRALTRFARELGVDPSEIQVQQAAFRFQQLNGWYERVWAQALEQPGAVYSDLDEANNRILIGVEHAQAGNAVRGLAARLGVPAAAIEVRVVEPVKLAATLRDNVNPKVGGLQIHFGNYLCTLGFNANFGGVSSFVTNSHCTNTQGGVEGTQYYQPTSTVNSTVIATEVADPSYLRGQPAGCPKNKRCRYSDSSRANYAPGVSFDLGGIAITGAGSLTIGGTLNITNEIDATRTPVAVGATVSKVGRTTGTSTGQVTNTCVNTSVSGSNIMQLCQTFVTAAVGSGDSGSPVFTGSALVGILWGGSSTQFVFSPLRSIKDELGNFTAH